MSIGNKRESFYCRWSANYQIQRLSNKVIGVFCLIILIVVVFYFIFPIGWALGDTLGITMIALFVLGILGIIGIWVIRSICKKETPI